MPRNTFRYAILAVLFACACWVRGTDAWHLIVALRNPAAVPELPFPIAGASRDIAGGPLQGDQILAIDGRPFTSYLQYEKAVRLRRPGEKIRLTLSLRDGSAIERQVVIPSQTGALSSFQDIAVDVSLDIVIPLIALFLGAFVVAVRPADGNAWLLFFLMICFAELAPRGFGLSGAFADMWSPFWGTQWPTFMMLFGIYFPDRSSYDLRRPWVKYVILVPCVLAGLGFAAIVSIWFFNLEYAVMLRPALVRLYYAQTVIGMVAIGTFFANIAVKARIDPSADSRRRLRLLSLGSKISLAPVFVLALTAVIRQRDIFYGMPAWALVTALLFLTLFPLTMAYVIVVQRAMDLRFVIRRGLQYGLAKVGLWVIRVGLIVVAVYLFTAVASSRARARGPMRPIELTAVGVGLLVLRRRGAGRASEWVDRRFFRESYNAEQVLIGLAKQVGRYVEVKPLLDTVAATVSQTLHTPDIVILLPQGDSFAARYSTRPGEPMNIASDGNIARVLRERNEALEIYYDKPPLWLRSLNAEELQTLAYMRTQLLLPLTANEKLTGIMSLGPKLSELPYTDTDIRLLQAIAWQMGLALENMRLVESLAKEAAAREIANRELEIAREVQERLFPQNYPAIPGLDCAGYCRPARGVGGDYYDFLQLEDGRLGIAIGDVSGKGIAAALLMASLQASLRGQAAAGVHDLSDLMRNVNKLVYEASTSNRYATFFYGEYHPETGRFRYVNAGHNPPVILRGDCVMRLEADGPVVGLLAGARYGQSECAMQPGDILIAFTDGISEALNEKDEEWEEDRFIAAAKTCRDLPAREIIRAIFREADAFTGDARQYDDMTLLVMKLT